MVNMSALTTPSNPDEGKNGTGQWKKGASGNPAGRPRGSRNKATLRLEQLLEEQGEVLLTEEIARAREGDRYARRFCLERVFPLRKEGPIELELPPVGNVQEIAAALSSVVEAVGTGQITPGAGEQIANLLRSHLEVLKYADFESRIQLLEQVLDPELEAAREQLAQHSVIKAMQRLDDLLREDDRNGGPGEPSKTQSPSGSTGGSGGEESNQKNGADVPHP